MHSSRADDAQKKKGKEKSNYFTQHTLEERGKLGLFRETHVEHVSLANYSEKGTLTRQVDIDLDNQLDMS